MISINNISKSYPNQLVLDGINLEVKKGSIQALLGVNGAGKSTLINILSGLLSPSKGQISINDQKINGDNKYRRQVGYVFENPMYIEKFSAIEYLTFVAQMYGLKQSFIKSKINWLIQFFELPASKKYIENYSKGMKSKVSLAAALIHEPQYLILDEPFDGIDFISTQKIIKFFEKQKQKGVTILIASHQFDIMIEVCDRFALLNRGRIEFNLKIQELTEKMDEKSNGSKQSLKSYVEQIITTNGK